jgi:uncharacterized peroxidase-related enzyme
VTGDASLAERVKADWRHAELDARGRALLELASMVNCDVHTMTRATLDGFRARGLADEDLLNVVHVVGFFNYYTRLADALGVEDEPEMPRRPPR